MLSLLIGLGIAVASGGAALVGKHLWSKIKANPVGIGIDAAALTKEIIDAAKDKKLTPEEIKGISDSLDDLAKRLK